MYYVLHYRREPQLYSALRGVSVCILSVALLSLLCQGKYAMHPLFADTTRVGCGLILSYALLRRFSIPLFVICCLLIVLKIAGRLLLNLTLSPYTLAEAMGATREDCLPFLTTTHLSVLLISLLLSGTCGYLFYRYMKRCFSRHLLVLALGVAAVHALYIPLYGYRQADKGISGFMWSVPMAYAIHSYSAHVIDALPSPADAPSSLPTLRGDEGCVFIIHIGESVRADHLSINGYPRRTDPFLASYPRIINFRTCISVMASTVHGMLAILTNARTTIATLTQESHISADLLPTCGAFPDLFAHNGFAFYSLADAPQLQADRGWSAQFNRLLYVCTRHARHDYSSGKESAQLAAINTMIREMPNTNLCILINNGGSHLPFGNYNHEKPPFLPASTDAYFQSPESSPAVAAQVINAYDNTIHATDSFIARIVTMLQGKPFVYLYISDHGEYLNEEQEGWKRSSDNLQTYYSKRCCEVPFFFLYSEEFLRLHEHFPRALAQLHKNSHLRVGQEHVFHTALGLFGLQTPYYDSALDLCTEAPEEYNGPCPANGGQATDGRIWY
ncbi:MAG: sulfatase-like hydrolase/transferase [Akkermansia sp.]